MSGLQPYGRLGATKRLWEMKDVVEMLETCGPPTVALSKLHAYVKFLSPHYAATMAGLIIIEDKIKGLWDWIMNLDFSTRLRKVANDALNGDTGNPDDLRALQRPESWAFMAAAFHPSTIFNARRSDNRKGCAVRVFHNSQCRKACGVWYV
jgi:hypothetical protein